MGGYKRRQREKMEEVKRPKDGNENKNEDNSCSDCYVYETAVVWDTKPRILGEMSHVSELHAVGAVKVGDENGGSRLESLYNL
jgi:hypothetical protein